MLVDPPPEEPYIGVNSRRRRSTATGSVRNDSSQRVRSNFFLTLSAENLLQSQPPATHQSATGISLQTHTIATNIRKLG